MTVEELRGLQLAFHDQAPWYRNERGRVACWLWQFDGRHAACEGRLEAIHLIGRQRIRNSLVGVDRELVKLAEWDPRNAAVACTHHHRRFDSHATPRLLVPIHALRREALEFVTDWGLEPDAERRFTGSLRLALAMLPSCLGTSDLSATFPGAREQPGRILAGQPRA